MVIWFCKNYNTLFSKYRTKLIAALSSTNATKMDSEYEPQSWKLHYPLSVVFNQLSGVLYASMLKCVTCNLKAPGLSHTGSSGLFRGYAHGQDTSEPQLGTSETQGIHGFVSCHPDKTEQMLKTK